MTFEDWMNELDGYRKYNKRSELIYHETIVDPPNDAVDHWKVIEKWLKIAYICGKIDASKYNSVENPCSVSYSHNLAADISRAIELQKESEA